jgi:hypothetical protein
MEDVVMAGPENFHLRIVCTDRGTHGERTLTVIKLEVDGELIEERVRQGQAPWSPAGTHIATPEGERFRVQPRIALNGGNCREAYHGGTKWRFRCATCREWPPVGDARMRDLFDCRAAVGYGTLDVSFPEYFTPRC